MSTFGKITSEDFVKLKFPTTPTISSMGEKLIFSIKEINQGNNKYRASLYLNEKGKNDYRKFSAGTHVDIMPKFSPDDKYVAFLSSRTEKGMQVFIQDLSGGEALQLTKLPGGVVNFKWSKDSKKIIVLTMINEEDYEKVIGKRKEETPSFILDPLKFESEKAIKEQKKKLKSDPRIIKNAYYREGTSYLEGKFSQIFIYSISTNDKALIEDGVKPSNPVHIGKFGYHYSLGAIDLESKNVYASRYEGDPAISMKQLIIKISLEKPNEEKAIGEGFRWIDNFQISPDGKYISFEGIREDIGVYDDIQIFLISIYDGTFSSKIITNEFNRDSMQSKWVSDKILYFNSPNEGKASIYEVNIESKEVKLVVGGDRNINMFDCANDGKTIVFEVSHSESPADIYLLQKENNKEVRITNANKKYLENHTPAAVETFSYERDGVNFQGWVLKPKDHDGSKLPVILEIHGGPSAMWSPHEKTMWHEFNTLVSEGYAIVFCNPRGSGGYGINFRGAVFRNWGELPAEDILKCLDTALEKYDYLDKEKVAVTGGSYGGYMTAWMVTHYNRFKAGVSQRGVYEFAAFAMTTDVPIWFEKQFDADLIDDFSITMKDEPLRYIKNMETPLLIIHSESDYRVPIATAEQFFWAGKRYGKTIELVRYPRDGHELSRSGEPRHIIDRINKINQWISKYI